MATVGVTLPKVVAHGPIRGHQKVSSRCVTGTTSLYLAMPQDPVANLWYPVTWEITLKLLLISQNPTLDLAACLSKRYRKQ